MNEKEELVALRQEIENWKTIAAEQGRRLDELTQRVESEAQAYSRELYEILEWRKYNDPQVDRIIEAVIRLNEIVLPNAYQDLLKSRERKPLGLIAEDGKIVEKADAGD